MTQGKPKRTMHRVAHKRKLREEPAAATACDHDNEIQALKARVADLERLQESQHLLVMKFTVVRSIRILAVVLEQSQLSPRLIEEALDVIEEVTKQIAAATTLDEVRELDVELQKQLQTLMSMQRRG